MAPQQPLGRRLGAAGHPRLASLYGRPLDLHRRLGVVLGSGRSRSAMGLGGLSLWALGFRRRSGLDLDSRRHMGPRLGDVAPRSGAAWLGTATARAASCRIPRGARRLDLRASTRVLRAGYRVRSAAGKPNHRRLSKHGSGQPVTGGGWRVRGQSRH